MGDRPVTVAFRPFGNCSYERLKSTAVSDDRRNTLVKFLCWRVITQRFSWAFIESPCDFVQVCLRVYRQVCPFGKYCLSKPFVFSFDPRCQGLLGSQK